MMKTMSLLAALLSAGSLLAEPAPTTWTVDSNTSRPADFRTLQDAHDNAQSGDVLHVIASSVSYGPLNLTKPLTIIGPGYLLDQNLEFTTAAPSARADGIVFSAGSSGSLITGLEIVTNVYFATSNVTLKRNMIRGTVGHFWQHNCSALLILQNHVSGEMNFASGENSAVEIRGNYIGGTLNMSDAGDSGRIEYNVLIGEVHSSVLTQHNLAASFIYGYDDASITFNWASQSAQFTGSPTISDNHDWTPEITFADQFVGTGSLDARWQLKSGEYGCVVWGTGYQGADPGMFSGPDPYVLSGLPSVPLVIGIQAPSSASAASGLPVSVTIQVSPPMSAPVVNQAPAK